MTHPYLSGLQNDPEDGTMEPSTNRGGTALTAHPRITRSSSSVTTSQDTPQGFAPDSAYSTWSADQREASDRMETYFNGQRQTTLALADAARGHDFRGCNDDGLARLAIVYGRELEDVRSGYLSGGKRREQLNEARLRDIAAEQDFRAALRECWLADERGTHCYTGFSGRGGLLAVRDHAAMPPSYDLAVKLDHLNHMRGEPTVLAWDDAA